MHVGMVGHRMASPQRWAVAALYERERVTHAPGLVALEDEMCAFTSDGLPSRRSPDRLDALVWAVGELLPGKKVEPRLRGL